MYRKMYMHVHRPLGVLFYYIKWSQTSYISHKDKSYLRLNKKIREVAGFALPNQRQLTAHSHINFMLSALVDICDWHCANVCHGNEASLLEEVFSGLYQF